MFHDLPFCKLKRNYGEVQQKGGEQSCSGRHIHAFVVFGDLVRVSMVVFLPVGEGVCFFQAKAKILTFLTLGTRFNF